MSNIRRVFTTYSPIYSEQQRHHRPVNLQWWQIALIVLGLSGLLITGVYLGRGLFLLVQTASFVETDSSEAIRQRLINSVR